MWPETEGTLESGNFRGSVLEGCHLACGLDEFRHRARQFAHVVNDQRRSVLSQRSPVLRAAMASTGEADRGHAGSEGGVDTCGAILDDETAVRRRRKVL